MTIGTKTLLFGVHQFLLHPIFVAWGWIKLYGWPKKWRIWLAFVIHDWGYWGCESLDDEHGELHPVWAAEKFNRWFDKYKDTMCETCRKAKSTSCWMPWGSFMLFHSRFLAKRLNRPISKLGLADKMAIAIEPSWLYLPRAWASGELDEFMEEARSGKYIDLGLDTRTAWTWHRSVRKAMVKLVAENKTDDIC